MEDKDELDRRRAVDRYELGESPRSIWTSLGRSKAWFYKWVGRRQQAEEAEWYVTRSHRPRVVPGRTVESMEQLVISARKELEEQAIFAGAQAIRWHLQERQVEAAPSVRTIGRILVRQKLLTCRHERYVPKGKKYPALQALRPGDVHQVDFVGPCYLRGAVRFHSLHAVDLASGRCGIEPMTQGKAMTVNALWAIWARMGMPWRIQADNESAFYGSPTHPRGMGKLIRLCLPLDIEPWFIPMSEPWRNGVVEKFNDHWQDKFLRRVPMEDAESLRQESLSFEAHHNERWRYSKLGGKTPLESLRLSGQALRLPPREHAPQSPLPKPQSGRYHLVRFIRSDGLLDVFGEKFRLSSQTQYEYVVATVDVAAQRLTIHLAGQPVDEFKYDLG